MPEQNEPTPIRITENDLRYIIAVVVALVLIVIGVVMLRPVIQTGMRVFLAREGIDLLTAMRTAGGAEIEEASPIISIDPGDNQTVLTATYTALTPLTPSRVELFCETIDFGNVWDMLQCELIDEDSYQITIKRTR